MKRLVCITLAGLVMACGPAVVVEEDEGTESGSSSDGGTSTTSVGTSPMPTTTPSGPSTSTSTTTTPQPTTVGPTTTPPTATDPTIGPGDSSSGPFIPDFGFPECDPGGFDCTEDDQCPCNRCYVTGIGGICSECSSDADCEFGCTPPNFLSNPQQGAFCNEGLLGDGCETTAACLDLQCVEVVDVPGIIAVSTCGECAFDADCMPGQLCDIDMDVPNLTGVWTCIGPDALGLGDFCALEGSGDEACVSGACAEGSLKGLITFGICSECEGAGDCLPGQTCNPPEISLDGSVVPGFCN